MILNIVILYIFIYFGLISDYSKPSSSFDIISFWIAWIIGVVVIIIKIYNYGYGKRTNNK